MRGKDIVFLRELAKGQTVFTEVEGFGATASDYDFRIENRKTGAGVRITGDRPLAKLLFWSANLTVCPEPYIDASVEPGKESSWRITYQFYQAAGGPRPRSPMMNRRDAITSISMAGGASLIPPADIIGRRAGVERVGHVRTGGAGHRAGQDPRHQDDPDRAEPHPPGRREGRNDRARASSAGAARRSRSARSSSRPRSTST